MIISYRLELISAPDISARDILVQTFYHVNFSSKGHFGTRTFRHGYFSAPWMFRHGDISVPHTAPRQNMQLNPSAVKSLCLNISVPKYLWYQNIPMQESPWCQNYPLAEISQCFLPKKCKKNNWLQ